MQLKSLRLRQPPAAADPEKGGYTGPSSPPRSPPAYSGNIHTYRHMVVMSVMDTPPPGKRSRLLSDSILREGSLMRSHIYSRIQGAHPGTVTHLIIYNSNIERAARTSRNLLSLSQLVKSYREEVAARTRIREASLLHIPCHVLNFHLVIQTHHYTTITPAKLLSSICLYSEYTHTLIT